MIYQVFSQGQWTHTTSSTDTAKPFQQIYYVTTFHKQSCHLFLFPNMSPSIMYVYLCHLCHYIYDKVIYILCANLHLKKSPLAKQLSPTFTPPRAVVTPRRCGTLYVGWVLCSATWVICPAICGETSSGKWWRCMGWSEGRFLGKLADGWVSV